MTPTDPLEALMAETGVVPASGSVVDWTAVEGSLNGLKLPGDYKRLIENFPLGRFKESVTIIRPEPNGEYLGYFAHRLDDYRGWRDDGDGIYPHPLYPEPGGLLPWGFTAAGGDLLFWLTDGDDPDRWPVVTSDDEQNEWFVHQRTVGEYLVDLLRKPPPEVAQAPAFIPDRGFSPAPAKAGTTTVKGSEPTRYTAARPSPQNRAGELIAAVGATPVRRDRDWDLFCRVFGAELPSDYRAFYDAVGAGVFCDIAIFGLDAPSPLVTIDLLRATRSRVAKTPGANLVFPLHPDPDGLIPWGATTDGDWTYFWDPTTWGVSAVNLGFRRVHMPDLSFSDFLLRYAAGDDPLFISEPRVWAAGPIFHAI